jgi:hypothetical protein
VTFGDLVARAHQDPAAFITRVHELLESDDIQRLVRANEVTPTTIQLWEKRENCKSLRFMLNAVRTIRNAKPEWGNDTALTVDDTQVALVIEQCKHHTHVSRIMHGFTIVGRALRSDAADALKTHRLRNLNVSLTNPAKQDLATKKKKQLRQALELAVAKGETNGGGGKRTAPFLAILAQITCSVRWVHERLREHAQQEIAALSKTKVRDPIVREVFKVLALVILSTRASRGNEVCVGRFCDFTCRVDGVSDNVWLLARAICKPGTIPRTADVTEQKLVGKNVNEFVELTHESMPEFMSLINLCDMFEWAMRIALALYPELLDPRVNPGMRVMLNPHKNGVVKTVTLNDWLRQDKTLPRGACTDKWLTTYTLRSTISTYIVLYGLLKDTRYERLIRWFTCGHSSRSTQIESYAATPEGVCIVRPDDDDDDDATDEEWEDDGDDAMEFDQTQAQT